MPVTDLTRARRLYAELIDTLTASGYPGEARACAELAVQQGVWRNSCQRPIQYFDSIPMVTAYDPRRFWVATYLERHSDVIREELLEVAEPEVAGFRPVEEPLVDCGRWDQVVFFEGGQWFRQAAARFPRTAAILERIPAEQRAGVIMFSWLHPGTHIISHCGFTNGRLRIHLGLKTPAGARIRVHGEERTWDAGRCLVFDDSIEHEVWHNGGEPRIVLICDVPHPGLAANDRNRLLADNALDGHERARRFMKDRGLRRVEHSRSGELQVELDRFTELNMRRFLSECGLHRMELTADGRLRTGTDGETHAAP